MRRLVIAIDCDDVLVDSMRPIIDRYNEKYNTDVTLADAYDEHGVWQANDRETAIRRVDTIIRDERILDDVQPFDDAVSTVKHLSQLHELHVVTGRQTFMGGGYCQVG